MVLSGLFWRPLLDRAQAAVRWFCWSSVFCSSVFVFPDKGVMWTCWVLLPSLFSLCTAAGLWLVYFVAVHDDRILPLTSPYRRRNGSFYAPYISNTGNFPPGSCVFSEVMNLAAFVGFVVAVLRFVQLRPTGIRPWLNLLGLVLFSASCFGLTLVGNFQLFTQKTVHNLGSLMTFGLGTLFCWVQSYITLKADLRSEGRTVSAARFVLSGFMTVCIISYFSLLSQRLHGPAARCQWAAVLMLLLFLGTFSIEFRHCRFNVTCTEVPGLPVRTSEPLSEASSFQASG